MIPRQNLPRVFESWCTVDRWIRYNTREVFRKRRIRAEFTYDQAVCKDRSFEKAAGVDG